MAISMAWPPAHHNFAIELTNIFLWHFYLLLPSFFLYILAWGLSELFAQICKEMERAFADGQGVGLFVQESGVRHSLICQAVWKLDEYFRSITLVNVVCIFVNCINCFVLILDSLNKRKFVNVASYSVGTLIRFLVLEAIAQIAERLKNKVHYMTYIISCKYLINLWKYFILKADSIFQCLMKSNLLHSGNEPDQVISITGIVDRRLI